MKTISVVIADDQALIRNGLRSMLHGEPHIRLAGEANDGLQLLHLIGEELPDVLLLDLRMPVLDGMQVIRTVRQQFCRMGVVVISQYMNARLVSEIARTGVLGFLDKDAVKSEVVRAIEEVHDGRRYTSAGISGKLEEPEAGADTGECGAELSYREIQVMVLLCEGKTNKEIAARLFISRRTAEKLRLKLYEKIRVNNVPGVLLYAIEKGYFVP